MKKAILLFISVLILSISFGASKPKSKPALKASEVMIPIGNTGQKISLLDLSRMSTKDVEWFTGKKMKTGEKLGFRAAQHKLRQNINPDGTLNTRKFQKGLKPKADVTEGFHLGGFALGFFLSIIGVLIAYLIDDEKKATRVKWAWIGFAVSLVLWILFAVI